MSADPQDVGVRVRSLLAAAGLPAGEREIAGLVAAYAAQRPSVDALFEVPDTADVRPVLLREVVVPRD
ncbi:hypothetical protein [Streptomyces alboflavus]|uniref:hypothetical protein n=1 Tax=Streptomyces alboflavus TaxID=67267 RepID=UPI00369E2E36